MTKPRVYWRPIWHDDQDPDDACWAVQDGNCSSGYYSWEQAYRVAYLTVALERAEQSIFPGQADAGGPDVRAVRGAGGRG